MSRIKLFLSVEQKRFLIVGVINTILSYILFSILLYSKLSYTIAYWVSMFAGVVNSYVLNKFWTFCVYRYSFVEFVRFIFVYIISFSLGTCSLYFLISILGFNAYLAGIINLVFSTLISWLGHKHFSFK